MEVSKEILQEVENLAGLFMTPEKIAVIVQIPLPAFMRMLQEPGNPVAVSFKKGYLLRESKLRKEVLDLAERGSSPAQTLGVSMMNEFHADLTKNLMD